MYLDQFITLQEKVPTFPSRVISLKCYKIDLKLISKASQKTEAITRLTMDQCVKSVMRIEVQNSLEPNSEARPSKKRGAHVTKNNNNNNNIYDIVK